MTAALLNLRLRLRSAKGEIRFWHLFSGLLIAVAYLMFPGDVNHFVSYLLNQVFSNLHHSFGHTGTSTTTTSTVSGAHK